MSERDDDMRKSARPDDGPARIVRLQDYETCRPDRVLRGLHDYWTSIRKGRAVPMRSDVDPRGISHALDYAFIIERIAPGAGRLRLAGRHLIDLMGMEVRGMPLCAFLNTSSRGRFSDVLESVFKGPQIARMTLHGKPDYARPELKAQMLLLPLRSDLQDVTRALGCLVAEGDTGVAPRRFDLVEDEVLPIIEGGKTIAPSPSAIGFAEEPQDFRPRRPSEPAAERARGFPRADTPEERRALFRVIQPQPLDDRDD
ncbi:PAS domain-containing protein [Paracoccus rhizosphaerae]|uniref:PAS domain-containing protein n=1 Tax=Paracoccus rhizosphaerae TaxID=1133347 RepID=A0ABV6CN54_9RHOB|nr:PAS domain-containing protein [Paracoccus rhizosphaerae]